MLSKAGQDRLSDKLVPQKAVQKHEAVAFCCRLCMRDLNEPPAVPHRGEKTCRSCWNVLASLRAHDLTLRDLNSDLMLDDPQHSAAFFCSVAALREEVGGPLAFDKVKHLLIKQVTLVVRASHQHLMKKPWRPMKYWLDRGYTEQEVLKAPQKTCGTTGTRLHQIPLESSSEKKESVLAARMVQKTTAAAASRKRKRGAPRLEWASCTSHVMSAC